MADYSFSFLYPSSPSQVKEPAPKLPNAKVQINGFPMCCGITILGAMCLRNGATAEKEGMEQIRKEYETAHNGGLLLYSLNSRQKPLQDLLLKDGWRVVASFINPNSHHKVCLLGKLIKQRKRSKSAVISSLGEE